jgi:putative DNA primase/helicase
MRNVDPLATADRAWAEKASVVENPVEAIPPEFSDESLALEFATRHADDLRYVHAWGKWLHWTRTKWATDDTLLAFDHARLICREASQRAVKVNRKSGAKIAAMITSAQKVAAIERLAKADRRLAATVDQWDIEPFILNTPSGVVDLRTGRLRPHRQADHCTKATAIGPADVGTPCPQWLRFLDRVTDGDGELIGFLQRVAGYALTGSTKEHALFFAYGTGRNGKGVFINTLTRIMADYAEIGSMDTFTASSVSQHSTDLAKLRGARLVTAQETEEGRRWAEAKIKAMTGGDPITARFMRQDFFTFEPAFKLVIAGNHKPGLRGVDEAIRARFNLIPFNVTIPPAERDLDLPDKLRAEWPAILRWMIEGCVEWQRDGLQPPAAVKAATDDYLDAEDAFGLWLAEDCTRSARAWENSTVLYEAWVRWADRNGEHPGRSKNFSQTLEARGFEKSREAGTGKRGFTGIALRSEAR